jgi:cytochrome oxidase Cu insertion factor (SCO1/SenC/PrrC family)
MNILKTALIVAATVSLVACGGAQRKASRAQAQSYKASESVSKERLRLVDQYQKCVKDAKNDSVKVEACDTYLKAAEALN